MGTIEVNIKENDSYTINKAMTIKNGNVKGGTFIVERSGVKFENISNIEAITVDEKVGSGDFTIKGCHEVGNMWVNGGGSNSIHIANSSITQFLVNKPLVRIVLEANSDGSVKIRHAIISQECKIESESGNSLENVIVANESAKVTLTGTMEIKNLVSKKTESVSKEGSSITISKENASLADTEIDETAINQAIKKANENLSDNTSIVKQDVPNGPKNLTLTPESCDDGILIKIANPPEATIESADYFMRVFIDGIGNVCQQWYNIYNDAPKEFFFPYVQKNKTYKVRIRFDCEKKDNNVTIWGASESLSWGEINVKANGGKGGDLMIVSPQEVILIDANGNFKLKAPEFAQEPNGFNWEIAVEPYEGQSWEVENSKGWKWLGVMYVPKSEINSTHSIYEYLQNYGAEGTIAFIGIFPRIAYTRGKTSFEYRWPAVTKDLESQILFTRQQYSKLDTTPLKVKNIEDRPTILLKDEEVYMFTYPIADCGSSQRKIRNGDEYTIDFSAKSTIDLEGSWMTLIYTKEEIDEDGNKFYGWWYYPAEDYWHNRLEENPPVSENESLKLKKTITISRRNAKADETPCILLYIKPKQYESSLTDTPLKEVSATITSNYVTITNE